MGNTDNLVLLIRGLGLMCSTLHPLVLGNCSLTWAWRWPVWASLSGHTHHRGHRSGKPTYCGVKGKRKSSGWIFLYPFTAISVQKSERPTWLSALRPLWAGGIGRRSSWPNRGVHLHSSSPPLQCSSLALYPATQRKDNLADTENTLAYCFIASVQSKKVLEVHLIIYFVHVWIHSLTSWYWWTCLP